MQRLVMTNTDNTDVEKLQLATFDKLHAVTRNVDCCQQSECERR